MRRIGFVFRISVFLGGGCLAWGAGCRCSGVIGGGCEFLSHHIWFAALSGVVLWCLCAGTRPMGGPRITTGSDISIDNGEEGGVDYTRHNKIRASQRN